MKRLLPIFLLLTALGIQAQTTLDTVYTKVNKMEKALKILSEFRVVAYAQVQFERADTAGAKSFDGGDFASTSNNRLMIRRGRVKLMYDHEGKKGFRIFQTTAQIDFTERGFQARDFWGRIIDPWTGWIGFQAGLMDRPFGYEVGTGDDTRETPERARLSQIIFPGEKDLGASLVIESPKTFKPVYVRLDAGGFNGLTVGGGTIAPRKDFITHLQAKKLFQINDKSNFSLSGGVSYYNGWVLQQSPNVFALQNNGLGSMVYTPTVDSAGVNRNYQKREYYGVDLQAGYDYSFGTTILRGEFIAGRQPGTSSSYNAPTTIANSDLYIRKFNGFYAYFVQTFKQKAKEHTIYHDIVFKYDLFNPNTQVKQSVLSTAGDVRESAADIKYQTFGIGYIFRPYDFFKLMLYYDFVQNPTDHVNGFTRDLKDNVLTIRAQFLFDTDWFNKKVKAL